MSKGLRLLKEFQSMTLLTPCAQMKLKIIEKELKALEIIKKHFNGVEILTMAMTQKEWKFIKEVLL